MELLVGAGGLGLVALVVLWAWWDSRGDRATANRLRISEAVRLENEYELEDLKEKSKRATLELLDRIEVRDGQIGVMRAHIAELEGLLADAESDELHLARLRRELSDALSAYRDPE